MAHPDPFAPPFPDPRRKGDVHLRILNTTDLHMNLRGYDYFTDRQTEDGGLARAATLIEALRKGAPNSLVLDNGDTIQGNPMGDYLALEAKDVPHPMIAALNTLGVDAATLGNHEFNFGLATLTRALAEADFPIVCANILTAEDGAPWLPPYLLLDRELADNAGQVHKLRIGITGFVPPQITAWDRRHLEGHLTGQDIIESALTIVPAMRADGADLVIALSHSGISTSEPEPMLENASAALARVPDIDVVIAGHQHRVFPSQIYQDHPGADTSQGTLHGTPVTMAGVGGSHIGVVDLLLRRAPDAWTIAKSRTIAPRVSDHQLPRSELEKRILRATQTVHDATRTAMRRPVGKTAISLHSLFGMIEPASSVLMVASAQAAHAKAAFKSTELANIPLLSAAAAFRLGGDAKAFTTVEPGDVTLRHIADLYAFPNAFGAVLVDGKALRDWLDHAVGFFNQVRPGEADQPLINPGFPAYNFDTITGITYQIDLAAPPRFTPQGVLLDANTTRIRDLAYKGVPVGETDTFIIATNDYRTSGLGTFPGADQGKRVTAPPKSHRDILIDYFRETPADRTLPTAPWSLTAPPGTSVTFTSAPGALTQKRPDVEQIGESETGLPLFRKTF